MSVEYSAQLTDSQNVYLNTSARLLHYLHSPNAIARRNKNRCEMEYNLHYIIIEI